MISIIIPCYNEQEALPIFYTEITRVLDEMHEKYTAISIKNTISILRSLKLSDQEIIQKLCEQYQMNEAQIQQYL